ncbi:DUF2787 domain-containing protein [Vibrio sp. VB16]|uniref:DUF2787 domain-containing protein n=1 Tax=Vibrio sp. VB16 TaxID=2785746 RepID=UPI001E4A420E|nr:DUF2787 domain-containing protein [Vibrio sp. VB16]UGA53716.1 DUF2787 domain-containing protein [Vibrio sp. VB16]
MTHNTIQAMEKAPSMIFQPCVLPISNKLHNAIQSQIVRHQANINSSTITLNFKDKSYSAETGGYHPVEISIIKGSNSQWIILYITDFAYFGLGYPELERDIDFDIGNAMVFATGMGWMDIKSPGITELFEMWQENFLAYLDMDVYDDIEITFN